MPYPERPTPFRPCQATNFFSGQGAFFLVDPERLAPELPRHPDLLKALTTTRLGLTLYESGILVPALGVEPGFYTVDVRSTQTEDAPLPLTHIVYSTGFVLGTETGNLLLANTDRLQNWNPGSVPQTRIPLPLTSFERTIEVSPGWYTVTVVVGLRDIEPETNESPEYHQHEEDYDFNQDPDQNTPSRGPTPKRSRSIQTSEPTEQWVCSFLLDPQPAKPPLTADLKKMLNASGA